MTGEGTLSRDRQQSSVNEGQSSSDGGHPSLSRGGPLSVANRPDQPGLPAKFWAAILSALLLFALLGWYLTSQRLKTLKKDFSILPYKPSQAEADSLEGIWLCYTGSPQARKSQPRRYHLVVNNIIEVRTRDGYFTFQRWGANFNHLGYMQFEAPWLVSIFSHVQNEGDSIQSPRHSLLQLNAKGPYHDVISASWSFDSGINNKIIGIREVYVKQGKGRHAQEILGTTANGTCNCKIVRWVREDGTTQDFLLRNQLLDTLNVPAIKPLLDEKSILLCNPEPGLILTDSTPKN
jgi:hypothetical protein